MLKFDVLSLLRTKRHVLLKKKKKRIELASVIFLMVAPIELLFLDKDSDYKSQYRLG